MKENCHFTMETGLLLLHAMLKQYILARTEYIIKD